MTSAHRTGFVAAIALVLAAHLAGRGAFLPAPANASPPPIPNVAFDTCGVSAICSPVPGRTAGPFRAVRVAASGVLAASQPSSAQLCARGLHPERAALVGDGAGGTLAAWIEPNEPDALVRALRRDSSGTVAPGWPAAGVVLCASSGSRAGLVLASDGAGGAIAAWVDRREPERGRIFAQRVLASGAIAAGFGTDGVGVTSDSTDHAAIAIAGDGSGGAYLAWQRPRASGAQLRLTRLAASGATGVGWPDSGLVICAHDSAQTSPVVIGDGAGGAIVAWEDHRSGTSAALYAARVTPNGVPAAGWPAGGARVSTATGAQRFARLAGDGGGGAYVVWHDARGGSGRLYAQHLSSTGSVSAGWATDGLGVSASAGEQFDAAAAADGTGGILIAWIDYRGGSSGDVYAQRFAADGTRPAGWPADGVALCVDPGDAYHPTVADVAAGAATVSWNDAGEDGAITGVIGAPARPERNAVQWIAEGSRSGAIRVRFALVSDAAATLEVVDVAGRRMTRRAVQGLGAGWHVASLAPDTRLAPGVYFVRLRQAGASAVTKAIVLQ